MVASPGTGTLGLFHLCFRPIFFRLFQRQCEYKLQLFVVLSVCLIMIAIMKRVSAWYVIFQMLVAVLSLTLCRVELLIIPSTEVMLS